MRNLGQPNIHAASATLYYDISKSCSTQFA